MAENQEIDLDAWQKLDLLHDEASNESMRAIRYFAHRLHEAQSNPHLRAGSSASTTMQQQFASSHSRRGNLFS